MLRSILVALSKNNKLKRLVMRWKPARLASSRFIAGETLDQAVEVVKGLNAKGINATLDQLGEYTIDAQGARQTTLEIQKIIDAIIQNDLRANVSVKLSQIGLILSETLCEENLTSLLNYAAQASVFIRIDMEGSDLTEKTFGLYRKMIEKGFSLVGIVLQSYLYRTKNDVEELLHWGGRVRLCKGAYIEPAEIAFPKKSEVDANFDLVAGELLQAASLPGAPGISVDGRTPPIPALATHDINRIIHAKEILKQLNVSQKALEFQMLYGIRRDLQLQLASEGYPVRVYVPFGTQWYPYFMRRLAERPANLWFFLSNFFRR
jgi:proline dehydrogenase